MLEKAPSGAIVSIGSERSFFNLGMSRNEMSLHVVDLEPDIIEFAQINAKLAAQGSLMGYAVLRTDAQMRAGFISPREESVWKRLSSKLDKNGQVLGGAFNGKNLYFENPTAFDRVASAAAKNQVHAHEADIFDPAQASRIVESVTKEGKKVSVIDLSNTLDYVYRLERDPNFGSGKDKPTPPHTLLRNVINSFTPVTQVGTVLVMTIYNTEKHRFAYHTFDFDFLKSLTDLELDQLIKDHFKNKINEGHVYKSRTELFSAKSCHGAVE